MDTKGKETKERKQMEQKEGQKSGETSFALDRGNVRMILLGVVVLFFGNFLLGVQDQFVDVVNFSVPLYIAPVVLITGFFLIGLGIFKRLGK
jgi:hypothetical protein